MTELSPTAAGLRGHRLLPLQHPRRRGRSRSNSALSWRAVDSFFLSFFGRLPHTGHVGAFTQRDTLRRVSHWSLFSRSLSQHGPYYDKMALITSDFVFWHNVLCVRTGPFFLLNKKPLDSCDSVLFSMMLS